MREFLASAARVLTVGALSRALRRYSVNLERSPLSDRRILYVAASCLPFHVSGYTTRTHEVIRALQDADADVLALTRPGYPWDRVDRCCDTRAVQTEYGNVVYRHLRYPPNKLPVVLYAPWAAKGFARLAAKERVSLIHAASNHVNALPALLAARQLGIPFQYEMRGLWELTRISRQPGYEGTQAFRQGLDLEGLVARHADRLFVISEQLGRYVHERWGVPKERISLLPNCVDPDRFAVARSEEIEPRSIGYAGSLIGYEGLDTLIEAVAQLRSPGVTVSVRIVGDGEARRDLETLAGRLGILGQVQFLGRQPPEVAREVIRRSALVCLPRKPFKVCEIVTPIKLVEALAMGKPVIVPDLPVFRDELGPSPAGWFFRAGDAKDLAQTIEMALADSSTLAAMGAKARQYAVSERCWKRFVPPVVTSLGR